MAENQPPHRTNEKFTDGIKPHWWPRVPPGKIGRLYANDARGLVDEDVIDDVGASLLDLPPTLGPIILGVERLLVAGQMLPA